MAYSNRLLQSNSNSLKKEFTLSMLSLAVLTLTLVIIFWPFAVIWAINTLFSQHITYSFWNWLAVNILQWTLIGTTKVSNTKKD
jgi:hypothetical protein